LDYDVERAWSGARHRRNRGGAIRHLASRSAAGVCTRSRRVHTPGLWCSPGLWAPNRPLIRADGPPGLRVICPLHAGLERGRRRNPTLSRWCSVMPPVMTRRTPTLRWQLGRETFRRPASIGWVLIGPRRPMWGRGHAC